MHQAFLMGVLQTQRGHADVLSRLPDVQLPAILDQGVKVGTVDPLHLDEREIAGAITRMNPVQRYDVRMGELRYGPGLLEKPCKHVAADKLGADEFQRDRPP